MRYFGSFDPKTLHDIESYSIEMQEAYNVYTKLSMRYVVFFWLSLLPGLIALYASIPSVAVTFLILAYYFNKQSDRVAHHVDMINLHWSLALLINNEANRVMQEILADRHKMSSA